MIHTRSNEIRVSEIFGPTIQGEGVLIGLPTVFVRSGGCDYRCSWCDSLHAVTVATGMNGKRCRPRRFGRKSFGFRAVKP